jgi:hypothetical protein
LNIASAPPSEVEPALELELPLVLAPLVLVLVSLLVLGVVTLGLLLGVVVSLSAACKANGVENAAATARIINLRVMPDLLEDVTCAGSRLWRAATFVPPMNQGRLPI